MAEALAVKRPQPNTRRARRADRGGTDLTGARSGVSAPSALDHSAVSSRRPTSSAQTVGFVDRARLEAGRRATEAAMDRRHATALVGVVALTACMLGLLPTPAAAEIRMQPLLTERGSGHLFVNNPGGPWSWQSCKPNLTRCAPFAKGRRISTDGAPPGTVFRVAGRGDVGTSPIWHGDVSVVRPPSARGPLRANERVTAVAATWSGGWDGDFDQAQLAICRTARGHGCISITDPKYIRGCRRGGAVLDPAFTGYYLRVADRHLGPGTIFTADAVSSPYRRPIWRHDGQTAVAIVGRIRRATGPQKTGCKPAPLNSASISELGVAIVKCVLGCQVALTAEQGPLEVGILHEILGQDAVGTRRATMIQLSADQLARFEPGDVRITVSIDGELATQRDIVVGS